MRSPLPLILLLPLLPACGGPPPQTPAQLPASSASAVTSASPPSPPPTLTARFADPALALPTFADPLRKAKILAAVPQLERHFAEVATKERYPGLVAGLVIDGELVWSKGYGLRDLESKQPVDADTVFRLASITKSFTGMALLQLRDAGKLSLDDPAERYLPELAGLVYPTRDAPRITLRMLVTHRGGLPHDPPIPDLDEHTPTDEEILKSLQGMTLDSTPGVVSAYSNLGFELAGMVVSRVSGMPYGDYLVSHVLRLLGMTSSGFDPDAGRLATGYMPDGATMQHPKRIELGANAAGGLFSTVRDLARYAAFELSAWPPRDDADDGPLRRSSLREAQQMSTWWGLQVSPRALGEPQRARAAGYGYGWGYNETCEWDTVVWHNGALSDGYHSALFMLPDRGIAVVALTNTGDEPQTLEGAVLQGLHLLGASGALAKRVLQPTPGLLAARDAILSLRDSWDDALAARMFDPAVVDRLSIIREHFAKDKTELGACHLASTTVDDGSHMHWEMECDRGGQRFEIGLMSDGKRMASMNHDNTFAPDARLVTAAARLASLVQRWDEKAYDAVAMSSLDRVHAKAAFVEAAASHGSCKVDHAGKDGDKMHARFTLSCTRGGPLELHAALDDKSGKVSDLGLTPPAEEGKKCP
jgi:CubicO group peptidase (beta-lactamase class C family)